MMPTVNMPLLVLRCRWADQANVMPAWEDAACAAVFLPSGPWWGVARYWQDCSFGLVDFAGSQLLGSRIHPFNFHTVNAATGAPEQNDRQAVIQAAVDQVRAEGVVLSGFAGVVVLFPRSTAEGADAGAAGPIDLGDGRLVQGALLNEALPQDVIAHEIGHVLGFEHSYGKTPDPTAYEDPYCLMSAQSYGHRWPAFRGVADPAVPAVGRSYRASMGPRPATAMLHRWLPGFAATPLVQPLPAGFRLGSGVRVRLYATDQGWAGMPILLAADTEPLTGPFEKTMLIEYRRATGWDQGLRAGGSRGGSAVNPAVVVHSVRQRVDPAAPTALHVVFEAALPIPLRGDADLALGGGRDLGLLVLGVAPDGRYVDLLVGAAGVAGGRSVTATIPDSVDSDTQVVEEGVADGVFIPPRCGTGRFSYQLLQHDSVARLSASSRGYELPAFTWSVNGIALPPVVPGGARQQGELSVPVLARFERPNVLEQRSLAARIRFEVEDQRLTLQCLGRDGSFDLWVRVKVSEADPGRINTAADERWVDGNLAITGQSLAYGEDWAAAVRRCWARTLAGLPSAAGYRSHVALDLPRARLFGTRVLQPVPGAGPVSGPDPHDALAAQALINALRPTLPGVAGPLQQAFDALRR